MSLKSSINIGVIIESIPSYFLAVCILFVKISLSIKGLQALCHSSIYMSMTILISLLKTPSKDGPFYISKMMNLLIIIHALCFERRKNRKDEKLILQQNSLPSAFFPFNSIYLVS